MGLYCDMDGNGCYDTQTCDLSYYDSNGCGMCMGNTTMTLSIYRLIHCDLA